MQAGFTFLELILVLLLIALLAVLAMPHYHDFLDRHQAQSEVEHIVRTITLARQQALLRRENITIYPKDTWSLGLFLQNESGQMLSILEFQYQAAILLKTFPAGSEHFIQFSSNGLTKTQNGSFYYCPKNVSHAKRIVFNQAGRVYVTTDEVEELCSSSPPGSL